MTTAYEYLRKVEHRLQMIDDEQTQTLPKADEDIESLAIFLGHKDGDEFRTTLLEYLGFVEQNYAGLFEESPDLGAGGTLVFTGEDDHPDTIEYLEKMGFDDGSRVSAIVPCLAPWPLSRNARGTVAPITYRTGTDPSAGTCPHLGTLTRP